LSRVGYATSCARCLHENWPNSRMAACLAGCVFGINTRLIYTRKRGNALNHPPLCAHTDILFIIEYYTDTPKSYGAHKFAVSHFAFLNWKHLFASELNFVSNKQEHHLLNVEALEIFNFFQRFEANLNLENINKSYFNLMII